MVEPSNVAILATSGPDAVSPTGPEDPLRLLAEGQGLLVSWGDTNSDGDWGTAFTAAAGLGRQLTAIAQRVNPGVTSAAPLFRVELPAGQTLQRLVPAVGGGYRGMTRGATGITGHARLVPVGGAAVGTGVALGPLVGLMALSVGAEMLARHQQDQQLAAIRRTVESIERHHVQQLVAHLDGANSAIRSASAALLDQIQVPQAVGFGPAVSNLRAVKHQALGWLERWDSEFAVLAETSGGVDVKKVAAAMGQNDLGGAPGFVSRVEILYRAIALDTRALVVAQAEANISNPDTDLSNFESALEQGFSENAEAIERLRRVLFMADQVRIECGTMSKPSTERFVVATSRMFARLAQAASAQPDAPALLTPTNRLVIEAKRDSGGAWKVRAPSAPAAAS